ncbi:MAG: hypothetical protein QME12_06335 [Nanoarchaeota archaeon]|nr:hypothetical protein [Nanoarchaeota archaeon]
MYDPLETDLSLNELKALFHESRGIPIALIGGWASYFYVNENYRRAFGKDYMGSRDIDIFFESASEANFAKAVYSRGFTKNGLKFRYEKIYDRQTKTFITQEQAKKKPIFDLIYIFLDLFSNQETKELGSWWDLEPLKKVSFLKVDNFMLVGIDTLIALKSTALFARDKADKENKDACDLYALIKYSGKPIQPTELLKKAMEKLLSRNDLIYAISEHVLLDPSKEGIVNFTLREKLKEIFR